MRGKKTAKILILDLLERPLALDRHIAVSEEK